MKFEHQLRLALRQRFGTLNDEQARTTIIYLGNLRFNQLCSELRDNAVTLHAMAQIDATEFKFDGVPVRIVSQDDLHVGLGNVVSL